MLNNHYINQNDYDQLYIERQFGTAALISIFPLKDAKKEV